MPCTMVHCKKSIHSTNFPFVWLECNLSDFEFADLNENQTHYTSIKLEADPKKDANRNKSNPIRDEEDSIFRRNSICDENYLLSFYFNNPCQI